MTLSILFLSLLSPLFIFSSSLHPIPLFLPSFLPFFYFLELRSTFFFSKFQIYNNVISYSHHAYAIASESISHITASLYFLITFTQFPQPLTHTFGNHRIWSLLVWFYQISHTSDIIQYLSLSDLIYLHNALKVHSI